ncbi:hypothetical protein [Candidatus Nitronereus thalassa]|uniref:Uncharacterized protein n=1 Tax=Candidatus Nitronereus thalassa TaxID=3020898 RepID=A0ABU3KBS8_9BACT|nr:hypothetical protein [Candidatus Nitronereus thalassa]MDT7043894.1 hypothetical protein [Candidatus Nitronereus thalassa]
MRDVAGYFHRRGFTIADCDDRSVTILLEEPSGTSDKMRSRSKADLLRMISGQRSFSVHSSHFE